MTDRQCERCGEVNPAEIHTCSPQEPVAWVEFERFMDEDGLMSERKIVNTWDNGRGEPLYTAPPQREWQGLTDEEAEQIADLHWDDPDMFIEAIEDVLRRKNS